jgi:hypothetical protein
MRRIAAIWTDSVNLTLHLGTEAMGGPYDTYTELNELGGRYDARLGQWFVPIEKYEEVLSVLDRDGFVWAVDDRERPRTWAGRMLAETPEQVHTFLYRELKQLLSSLGVHDHVALLESEWDARYDARQDSFDV